jgi:hypothetical protein
MKDKTKSVLIAAALVAVAAVAITARRSFLGPAAWAEGRSDVSSSEAVPEPPGNAWEIFDLSRLPAGPRDAVGVLLLVPVGVLITSLVRNVIGLSTYGAFTPSLLAVSFLYAEWRAGLAVAAVVLGVGLIGRWLVERLRLMMVSRLGVILTLVVLATALSISALEYFAVLSGVAGVILLMVILTVLIERVCITAEEDGVKAAVKRAAVTFAVAWLCLLALGWSALAELAVRYPESLLVVAAALLLAGRYSGYRLAELVRFRDLADSAPRQV